MLQKKAQAWGFDLMMASTIFIVGIVAFYLYALNMTNEAEEIINSMGSEGNAIANALLSNSFPTDWDATNVVSPGILTDSKINQTKLERFYALSIADYQRTKSIFNAEYEYYIYLSENFTISGVQVEGIGNKPIAPKNLIKITRLTIYNNTPVTFYAEIWE